MTWTAPQNIKEIRSSIEDKIISQVLRCHPCVRNMCTAIAPLRVCLSYYPAVDAIAIPGYYLCRKSHPPERASGCLVYVRNSIPASLCQDPQLNCVKLPYGLRLVFVAKPWWDAFPAHQVHVRRISPLKWHNKLIFHLTKSQSRRDTSALQAFAGQFLLLLTACSFLLLVFIKEDGYSMQLTWQEKKYPKSNVYDWFKARPHIHRKYCPRRRSPAR